MTLPFRTAVITEYAEDCVVLQRLIIKETRPTVLHNSVLLIGEVGRN